MLTSQQLIDLANKYDTPCYVYDFSEIQRRIQELKDTIGMYPNSEFLYAVKANHNPHVVKFIVDQGFGIDAVSTNEVKVALLVGCPKEKIMYTENNMSDPIMDQIHNLGILINFNSLSRLKKFGQKYPGSKVCVRFNPNVGAASHSTNITGGPNSKFGIPYQQIQDVLNIVTKYDLQLVGVHQHIGSGWIAKEEPLLAMDVILDIARQIPGLEFVDFGGGFGIPYRPEQEPNDMVMLGQEFKEKIETFNQEYGKEIKIRFEPGRYPVQASAFLLTEVTTIKATPEGKVFAGTNTGMNHLVRPAMYGSYHPIRNLSNPDGSLKTYDVTGNICESADFFGKDRELPEIRESDILSIDMAGAYGASMSNNYHLRSHCHEIAVDLDGTDRLIRKKQTFEELIEPYDFHA